MKRNKEICLILTVIFMMTLLFQPGIVRTAGCASVTVQLEVLSQPSQRQGVILNLYRVGEVSDVGLPVLQESYGITEYPQSARQTEKAASYIAAHLDVEAEQVLKTSAEGSAVFRDIDNGVYLLIAKSPNAYGIIDPVLFHIPYYEVIDGVKKGPLFQITVKPKAAANEYQNAQQQETQNNKNQQEGQDVGTGDDSNLISYILLAALAAGGILCLFIKKRKGGVK